ncbi:MAG: cadherin domain-containing protein, partial [Chitinophagaceae bacterium]
TGTDNTVADNTITNIDIRIDALSLSSYRMFTGLSINNTQLQLTNNRIGDTGAYDAIRLTANGTGDQGVTAVAIRFLSPTGGSITGNEIGGITFDGNLNSTAMGMFIGINVDMNPAPSMEFAVTGNMIGSTTVPDNIRTLSPGMPMNIYPIYTSVNTPAVLNVSGNTVAGIQSAYSGTGASPTFYGIRLSGTAGAAVHHNTITGITAVSPAKMTGIELSTSASGAAAFTISDNNIHGLRLTGTDPVAASLAANSMVTGIYSYGTDAGPTVYGNRIYDLTSGNTFTAATPAAFTTIRGIAITGKYTAYNNLVSLTNGNNTNNCSMTGVVSTGYSTKSDQYIYHNTIYIGGNNGDASNTAPSYVAGRTATNAAMRIKNNLLVNDRSGGGAPGYIFYNALSAPTSNWAQGVSDNNTIVTARVNAIGLWNTNTLDSTQWQTTAGDVHSVFYTTSQVSPANLFVNAAAGNLAIKENARNYVAAKGTTGTGVTADFAGITRSTTAPAAGAYEYEYVPVDNNAPTGLALSATSIEENKPAGSTVGVFTATDPDAGNTFTYSLVSGDGSAGNEAFTITGDALTINFPPDYETQSSYSIRVRATDQGLLYYEKTFTINITDLTEQAPNNAPSGLALSATSIEENKPAGSTVGVFTATDPDAGNTFTYSLVSGDGSAGNEAFTITGDALTINFPPDYETQSSYSIRVRVTDQGTLYYEKIFTITITDLTEQAPNLHAPVITSHGGAASATLNVAENQAAVTTVTATDADAGATITYSLVGNDDDSYFTVNATTGQLVFNAAPDFERPADPDENNMYMVTVQASDGELTAVQRFKVRVSNVNDNAPEFGSYDGDAAVTLKLNEGVTAVGGVWAVDKEPGTAISYSILNDQDGALFSVDPVTGLLVFITAPDYENPADQYASNVYIVTVQASDGELASLQRFKIKIMDVNEGTGRAASHAAGVPETDPAPATDAAKGIKAYPNPVTGRQFTLRISDLQAGKYSLELYSLTGQLVYRRLLEHTGKSISYPVQLPASLTRGMYVLKLAGAGVLHREKLLID